MLRISALLTMLLFAATWVMGGEPRRIPIILDTDIGSDIDDAFALALVMSSPEFELLGVTTVSGDTAARARIAAKMLWNAGGKWKKVPVVAGTPGKNQGTNQGPWAEGFTSPQILHENAVDFLRDTIHSRPNQVTIIAIGELSNIAALIKTDPCAAHDIKQISLMGGSISRGYGSSTEPAAEWNFKSDPVAAQVVFTSGIPILMAPLDVTAMLGLDSIERRIIFARNTPVTNSLAALYGLWKGDTPILFDPMAVAIVLNPKLCDMQNLAISVDDNGFTHVEQDRPPNATVGLSTNPGQFIEYYVNRVMGSN
jgi:purine nucleosidase